MRKLVFIAPILLFLSFGVMRFGKDLSFSSSKNKSCGFVENVYGQRISWKGHIPIPIYLHESVPQGAYDAISKAMLSWDKAAGKELFYIAGYVQGPKAPHKDGKNVIYWFKKGEWNFASSDEQARTNVYWVRDQIREADMKINSDTTAFFMDKPKGKDDVDLESVVIHELGHVLGLAHREAAGSVMASELASRTKRRHISGSDASFISCEY